jgi:hypothetical protein
MTHSTGRSIRTIAALAALGGAAGCETAPPDDDVEGTYEPLNGTLLGGGVLTRRNIPSTDETARRADTDHYYNIGINDDGSGGFLQSDLPVFNDFKSHYGFGGTDEVKALYYNRGDLGIGREMHCVDHSRGDGQIACYVKNFFAADGATEFGFGLSADIAFANMDAGKEFATVAMVYRAKAPAEDKVYFAVYGADPNKTLARFAALDRHALNFVLTNPPEGTPGKNFNLHIPTNCTNCHAGRYNPDTHTVTGALFLPFDLDQFDYQDVAGRRRQDQLAAFAKLNAMARKVAVGMGDGTVVDQIDGWYGNLSARSEVLTKPFNSSYIPGGWQASTSSKKLYREVIRPYCRNCHMAISLPFNGEIDLLHRAGSAFGGVCGNSMPHALQSLREFWFSRAPETLAAWYRTQGFDDFANELVDCGRGSVVTLDPHLIASAQPPF